LKAQSSRPQSFCAVLVSACPPLAISNNFGGFSQVHGRPLFAFTIGACHSRRAWATDQRKNGSVPERFSIFTAACPALAFHGFLRRRVRRWTGLRPLCVRYAQSITDAILS
jgi:hypothetical protein